MNFKFGRYIHRVHPSKSPLNIWEKRERGRIQGLPKFLEYPLLSQEWVVVVVSAGANIGGTADQTPPSCAILCRLQQLVC